MKTKTFREGTVSPEISTPELRNRLWNAVEGALINTTHTLLASPTGSGKSYTVATTPWSDYPELTGGEPVIHISPTRAARDDAAEKSENAGVTYTVLYGREDACPVAAGEYDTELPDLDGMPPSTWLSYKCEVEHWPFSWAHKELDSKLDGLPCVHDGVCGSQTQWTNVPRNTEGETTYDVIHATASFAYVQALVEDANVFFDEFPEYSLSVDQNHLREVTTGIVQEGGRDDLSWESLLIAVREEDAATIEEYRALLDGADYKWWRKADGKVDAKAPIIVRAIMSARPAGDGVLVGRWKRVSVVIDKQNTLTHVSEQPDLSKARCVIGFDAHPSALRWELSTGLALPVSELLSDTEKRAWRRRERALTVVQVGENTRSLTSGWRQDSEQKQAVALIRAIAEKHGADFQTCICPKAIEPDVRNAMETAGVVNPRTMHFGEEKSRNDFAAEPVGLVLGCIDPGDRNVLAMLRLLGLRAEPERYENGSRKHGRGFVGENAEAAEELLESVRQDGVSQAIGRYARQTGDAEKGTGAIVYVWSDAIPEGMVDHVVSGVKRDVTEKQRKVETVLKEAHGPMTKTEVAEAVDVSGKYAWEVLGKLVEQGIATVSKGTGKGGGDEYEYVSGTLSMPVDIEFE